MTRFTSIFSTLFALVMVLTACANVPAAVEPTTPPEPTEITTPPLAYPSVPAVLPTDTPPAHPRPDRTPINAEPLLSLRQRLAEDLGLDEESIYLIEMWEETWSDGCLGAALPGEMCTQAIVPGFLIFLDTPNGKIEVHTDESMRVYRIASLLNAGGLPLVSWNRSGGIAGICWQMDIYPDGAYRILDCASRLTLAEGSLSPDAMQQIMTLAGDLVPFEWATPQVQGADMFTDTYTWFGTGSQIPDTQAQEHLNNYLGSLASLLVK